MKSFIVSLAVLMCLSSVTMSSVAMAQDKNKADPKAAWKVEEKKLNENAPPPSNWQKTMTEAAKKKGSPSGTLKVWGIGPDSPYGRVYLWTGASWSEPSPTARLSRISRTTQGGAWGIGDNKRIFMTTNGVSWIEPNPTAKLNQISGNLYAAWGIGDSYRIFLSINGGKSWFEPTPQAKMKQISAGNFDNVWGVTPDGHVLKYSMSNTWEEPSPTARLNQISAMAVTGGE